MKVLLDACISESTIQPLREAGHDVEWVGSWNRDPGDREILEYAFRNRQILITLDKDFGELAIVHGVDHFGIVRIVGPSVAEQASVSRQVLERYGIELQRGAIVTAEVTRMRIRVADS